MRRALHKDRSDRDCAEDMRQAPLASRFSLRAHARTLQSVSAAFDILCIAAGYRLAIALYNHSSSLPLLNLLPKARPDFIDWRSAEYVLFFFSSILLWVGAMRYLGVYRSHRGERLRVLVVIYLQCALLTMFGTGFAVFAFKLGSISRNFSAFYFALVLTLLLGKQVGILIMLRFFRSRGRNVRRALVFGDGQASVDLVRKLRSAHGSAYQVNGTVTSNELRLAGFGNPDEAVRTWAGGAQIDEVFALTSGSAAPEIEEFALRLMKQGRRVHLVPCVMDARLFRKQLVEVAGITMLSIGGSNFDDIQQLLKRAMDIVGASVIALVLSPLLALIAGLIKLTSPGAVLFAQERLGENGRRFLMFKFRTMRSDAEAVLRSAPGLYRKYVENDCKLPENEDPRIAPIGRFLRRTSLDELPQLINVLKGDMSLVGPRPIFPSQIENYGDYAKLFLSVRPGLTGFWQVNGRSTVKYPERGEMDLEYVRDQSLKIDIDILFKTISAVVSRRGAF